MSEFFDGMWAFFGAQFETMVKVKEGCPKWEEFAKSSLLFTFSAIGRENRTAK